MHYIEFNTYCCPVSHRIIIYTQFAVLPSNKEIHFYFICQSRLRNATIEPLYEEATPTAGGDLEEISGLTRAAIARESADRQQNM